ncbi:MAG: Spy/CpxP family protein refolding chaperone [Opitutae bacterium]|nr:Spy/CpxP family protein refolding chaperone [Opitutae bacterium]
MKAKLPILLSLGGLTLFTGLLVAAVDGPPTPGPANPPPPPGAMAGPLRAHLTEQLGLTADQQAKFDELMQKQRGEIDALRANQALAPDDRRAKAKAIAESYRSQFHAFLTPEQQKKADELRARMHERMARPAQHAQRERHRDLMRTVAMSERIKDRIAEKLQLTTEQRDKLEHLGREFRAKQREAMKAHFDEMRAVLTPEQQKKVDEWKEGRGPGRAGHFGPGKPDGMPPPPSGDENESEDDAS